MFHDINQGKADKAVISISAGTVEPIGVDKGVATLGGSTLIREFFKPFTLPWDGRVEPGVEIGMDVDNRAKRAVRGTIRVHPVK